MPPSARSVSATRAGIASAGWQQVKISRSRSSTIVLSSSMDGSSCWASRRVSSASRSARSATDRFRRRRSIARRRAAVVIHAPGLAGTPSRRHAVTAASNASCTASSASWKSPACRISVASTIARSSRNARATAAETGSAGCAPAHARSFTASSGTSAPACARHPQPLVGRHHRAHLDRPPARHRHPRGLPERLVEVGALQDVVAGQDLLGHRERAVGDLRLSIAHAHRRRALRRMQALDAHQQPRLAQAAVQLHEHRQLLLALGLPGRVDLLLIHQQHVLGTSPSDVRGLRRTLRGAHHHVAARRAIWTARLDAACASARGRLASCARPRDASLRLARVPGGEPPSATGRNAGGPPGVLAGVRFIHTKELPIPFRPLGRLLRRPSPAMLSMTTP